jgi:hypothetical protein
VEDVNDDNYNADININDIENEIDEENEISDDIFNLKEEEIKTNQKIKIAYDTTKNEGETTSLDKSLQLYQNNINIIKPKYFGKTRVLFYFNNTPIFILPESSK